MQFPHRWIVLAALASGCWLAAVAGADDPPTETDKAIARLISQLGAPSYMARQQASRKLVEVGIAARTALLAASRSADAEVRSRALSVLQEVNQADFNLRLQEFAADTDGGQGRTLPGWDRFSKQFGSAYEARQFFVEMSRAEPDLLAAYGEGPAAATAALGARLTLLNEDFDQKIRLNDGEALMTQAALLLVGSADGVSVNEQVALSTYNWLVNLGPFKRNLLQGNHAGLLRRVLGQWMAKDIVKSSSSQYLYLATELSLRDDAITLATRVLEPGTRHVSQRYSALMVIAQFGSEAQLPIVTAQLTDEDNCGSESLSGSGRMVEIEVRDAALSTLLYLTKQSLADYGKTISHPFRPEVQLPILIFPTPADRQAVFAKWETWRAAHAEQFPAIPPAPPRPAIAPAPAAPAPTAVEPNEPPLAPAAKDAEQ